MLLLESLSQISRTSSSLELQVSLFYCMLYHDIITFKVTSLLRMTYPVNVVLGSRDGLIYVEHRYHPLSAR